MAIGSIIVADDHPLFRDALRQAIEGLDRPYGVLTAGEFEEVADQLEGNGDVELVLLDLNMPGNNGLAGLLRLRTTQPAVPVVIISATEDAATVRRALDLGASGYIPKSTTAEAIRSAIATVLDGEIWVPDGLDLVGPEDDETADIIQRLQTLTPQQNRVLGMLCEGLLQADRL